MTEKAKLDSILETDLRDLLLISYIVLCNNAVTDRYITRTYDMPVQAWSALLAVVRFPGIRAKEIQQLFPRPQNTISRAISLLEKRKLIRHETPASDAREKWLYPTITGTSLLEEILSRSVLRQEEIFSPLTRNERTEFFRLARKISQGPMLKESRILSLRDEASEPGGINDEIA